jgi:hypothetical protein
MSRFLGYNSAHLHLWSEANRAYAWCLFSDAIDAASHHNSSNRIDPLPPSVLWMFIFKSRFQIDLMGNAAICSCSGLLIACVLDFWSPSRFHADSICSPPTNQCLSIFWSDCFRVTTPWCLTGPVGKSQEEGMMSTTVSFSLVWNQNLIDQ